MKSFEELDDFVCNLGLNVSGFCDGDTSKSMPVTQEEYNSVIAWEYITGRIGSISIWIHVEEI